MGSWLGGDASIDALSSNDKLNLMIDSMLEKLRENKAPIEREVRRMERQWALSMKRIKELAHAGRRIEALREAKARVAGRRTMLRLSNGLQRLTSLENRIKVARTENSVLKATRAAVHILQTLSAVMDPAQVARLTHEYMAASERYKTGADMMEEAMGELDEMDEEEEEEDETEAEILDAIEAECKLSLREELPDTPSNTAQQQQTAIEERMTRLNTQH